MAESIKRYIVDASFILSYLLPDEEKDATTRALFEQFKKGTVIFLAPELLPFEVCNSIKVAIIRHRITSLQAKKLIKVFLEYGISFESINFLKTFLLAEEHNLSLYDASYLALAKTKRASLLTADKRLQALV